MNSISTLYIVLRFVAACNHFITNITSVLFTYVVCWISKYFFCQNHYIFTHFSIITILRLFPNKNISPFRRSPPLCFLKKSRSKEHFTCLISTEIYDLRKLIVMDIPRHLTEVLSLSRGDTALGEDFFFGGSEISPRTFLEKGPRLLLFTCCRSERLVKVRTNSKFAFSLDVSFIIFMISIQSQWEY